MNNSATILIATDEQADIELLTSLFMEDYELQVSHTGKQALEFCEQSSPDIVLLGNKMPDMNAYQLCEILTSGDKVRNIPVIIISDSNQVADKEKAFEAGAIEYITRPLAPGLVKQRIRNRLDLVINDDVVSHIREQIEESLYEQKQLLAAISSILIGLDQDGKITLWNRSAERLFDIHSKDTRGETLAALSLDWIEPVQRAVEDCRQTMQIVRTDDIAYTRTDGSNGFLGFSLNPIMHKDDTRLGVLIVGADITSKKDMEKQLLQAQKLESIGQLAAGIAHEINTPVQFIGSNLAFLSEAFGEIAVMINEIKQQADGTGQNSQTAELPELIEQLMQKTDIDYLLGDIPEAIAQSQEGVDRVSKIVTAMKDFSHRSDVKSEADLNRAIESTITVAQSEWKLVAEMKTEFDPELPPVPCLLSEFNQVILNMIVNATHAITDALADTTGAMGTITISTRKLNDSAEIRVSDTGAGIPEEIRSRIFDPFFTTKEVGKGTGQGLSIAHSVITQKHGGTISVESTPGKGTTFIIMLPLHSN